jgi:hypothetical protein
MLTELWLVVLHLCERTSAQQNRDITSVLLGGYGTKSTSGGAAMQIVSACTTTNKHK